jgi:ribosomal protein S8
MGRPKGVKNKKGLLSDYKYVEKGKNEMLRNALIYQFKKCSPINYLMMNMKNLEANIDDVLEVFLNQKI